MYIHSCYNALMQWNESTQERFNWLRVKKFEGELNAEEVVELATLQNYLEQETETYLSPLITSLEQENAMMLQKLDETHEENVVLLRIIAQQKQLVADARHWLSEFNSRHNAILQSYQRATGEPLVV